MKLIRSCLSGSAGNVKANENLIMKNKSYIGVDNHNRNGHLSVDSQIGAKNATKKKIINKSFENLTSANRLSIKTANAFLVPSDSNSHSSNPIYLHNQGGFSTKNQKSKKTTLSTSPKHQRKPSTTRASKKAMVKRGNMT